MHLAYGYSRPILSAEWSQMLSNPNLLAYIAEHSEEHSRLSPWWMQTDLTIQAELDELFRSDYATLTFGDISPLVIENVSFGTIEAKHLFGLDELIIFAWYAKNRKRYSKTLDLGANIGVHSLVMSKVGFHVTAYEPDPAHSVMLQKHLEKNSVSNVDLRTRAIADKNGEMKFTRVIGNTTGSHLSGAKQDPYGELEEFAVNVDAFQDVIEEGYDLIKMDVEGFEAKLLQSLNPGQLKSSEIMLEVGSAENARLVWTEILRLGLHAYSQKENWGEVTSVAGVPQSYKEGSLFITQSPEMSW